MSNRFKFLPSLEMNISKYLCWILLVLFRKVRKLFQMMIENYLETDSKVLHY